MSSPCQSACLAGILLFLGCVGLGMSGKLAAAVGEAVGNGGVDALVEQLGAERFALREEASQSLWEMGMAVVPALEEACGSDDPEIRVRARKIVADLELGILVDTPAETVALLREYHSGGYEKKVEVLQRLRSRDQILPRLRLLLSEENREWREEFVRKFAGTGDEVLEVLRQTGRLDEADELLAIVSPRSWAVYLMQNGMAGERVVVLREEWGEGQGVGDPSPLFWLLVMTDQPDEARAVAEQSKEAALRREIYLRQLDWKAMLDVDELVGTNEVEKLGFKAWFLRKAGDEAGAREAIDDLLALELDDDRMGENRAVALLILGEFDQATRCFQKLGEMDADEFGFYVERLQFDALAGRLGVDPAGDGVGAEMENRIEKTLKVAGNDGRTARRELFNLCRSLGEFLIRVGNKEEARKVLVAAKELVRDEATYLSYLARTCRSAGFIEEAEAMELEVFNLGGKTHQLSAKFPQDRVLSQFWWDFLRSRHPDEDVEETLKRISGILKAPKEGEEKGREAPIAEALEWVEKQGDADRTKYYGALADHYEREEDWESAASYLRKQSALSRTPVTPLLEAGDMFAKQEDWASAVALYAEARKADSGSELAMYLHGNALSENGQGEEGELLKAEAMRMPLANSNRRNTFASGLHRRGFVDVAIQQWELLLKTAEHDDWDGSDFWTLRGIRMQLASRVANDDPELAADYFEFYLMSFLKTNTTMPTRSYLSYHARVEALRVQACLKAEDVEGVNVHLRRCIAVRPSSTGPVLDAVGQLEEAGRTDVADELHDSLAGLYSGAVERFPQSARYHNSLAEIRFKSGDREQAITLAKRCVELEPDSATYQSQLERFSAEVPVEEQP